MSTFFDRDEALGKDLVKDYALNHERSLLDFFVVILNSLTYQRTMIFKSVSKTGVVLSIYIGFVAALILAGYEFIRSPSNTLYVQHFGKQNLPLIMALVPVGVFIIVYIYGRLISWCGPQKTMLITTLGSAGFIIGCWTLLQSGYKDVAAVLFIFRSAYVMLLIEQCWSLINTSLDEQEAKRLNGPICGIASVGAILGGIAGEKLTLLWGTQNMIAIAGILTLPAALFSILAYKAGRQASSKFGREKELIKSNLKPKTHLGFEIFKTQPILVFILIMVLLTQGLIGTLGILFQGQLNDFFPNADLQTAYSFRFYTQINILAALGQFLIAPFLLPRIKNHSLQVLMPVIMLVFIGNYLRDPGLQAAGLAFMAFKALDYSLFRASKELFYVPLNFDARFRTKEVIDIFGYRMGKGLAGTLFDAIQRTGFILTEASYAIAGIIFTVLWLFTSVLLTKFRPTKYKQFFQNK